MYTCVQPDCSWQGLEPADQRRDGAAPKCPDCGMVVRNDG